jgi:four helix bundle protein
VGSYLDLEVYRRAAALSDRLFVATAGWSTFAKWTVGVQLQRAGDSVGANIAEAYGRAGRADRRRFLVIAKGSACELHHWLTRAQARELALPHGALSEAGEIRRMLWGLERTLRADDA